MIILQPNIEYIFVLIVQQLKNNRIKFTSATILQQVHAINWTNKGEKTKQ